jgi:AraC family transcriptional regulator
MKIAVGLSNDASRPWALPAPTEALTPRECDLAGRAQVTRRHTQVMACRAEKFGPIGAELFLCRSNQYNELEIRADAHILLMRYSGMAARCEIRWPDHSESMRLSELRERSILFSPARSCVRVSKKDHGCYAYIALQIPPAALELLDDGGYDLSVVPLRPQAGIGQLELCKVILAIRDEIATPEPAGQLYKETLALQLLIRLVRCGCDLSVGPAKGGLAAWQLRRAIELIESDLTATPSLAELASHAGLSLAHFCTAFKQSAGVPPHRYLLNRRIARAKALMAEPTSSLTEIARESGFGSSSQFATAFRRIEGQTPSEFRRNL